MLPTPSAPLPLRSGCEPACRGCTHRTLSAEASEAQKFGWLASRLEPWRDRLQPLQAVRGEARWCYRDRAALSAGWRDGAWQFGMVVRDELLPIPDCPVHTPRLRAMIRLLGEVLPEGLPLAYYVQAGGQATLILRSAELPECGWLDEAVAERLVAIGIEGLWLHAFPAVGRNLFAKRGWRLLWGEPRSRDANSLLYGPTAFQQLIPGLYRHALDAAEAFLAPSAESAVIDLYCGNGSTLARWVARGAAALGVELGGEAVELARFNAPGATVLRGTCETRLPQLRAWGSAQPAAGWLLYTNPPRSGMEDAVVAWIVDDYRPQRIAYLSCSAGTLHRDLQRLVAGGYRVVSITPYDFFPQTYHVETLVLLER